MIERISIFPTTEGTFAVHTWKDKDKSESAIYPTLLDALRDLSFNEQIKVNREAFEAERGCDEATCRIMERTHYWNEYSRSWFPYLPSWQGQNVTKPRPSHYTSPIKE